MHVQMHAGLQERQVWLAFQPSSLQTFPAPAREEVAFRNPKQRLFIPNLHARDGQQLQSRLILEELLNLRPGEQVLLCAGLACLQTPPGGRSLSLQQPFQWAFERREASAAW